MSATETLAQVQSLALHLLDVAIFNSRIHEGLTKGLHNAVSLLKILLDGEIYTTAQLADLINLEYKTTRQLLASLRKGGIPFHPDHCGGSGGKGNFGTWQLLL